MISQRKSGKKKTAKKRYAGLIYWAEGQDLDLNSEEALEVMGFESKRSDSSELSRDVQKKVIRMLLEGNPVEDQRIYISGIINKLSNGEYDLEYIGIPRGLSMNLMSYKTDNPHRRAAMYSNEHLGAKFGVGDKPKIIYCSSTGKYPRTDVVAFIRNEDLPEDFIMDVNTMIEKSINMKLDHILDSANLSLSEILHGKPMKLEGFF